MKGVVLAGGTGSRLYPLTKSINKHCLPIYDRPMVYYPIQSLVKAGITDIILVAGGNHMSQFIDLLGDGSELGCHISYVAQMKPGGIAEAISLVRPFCRNENICVILGDNIFVEDISSLIDKFDTKFRPMQAASGRASLCGLMCKWVTADEAINYGILSHGGGIHGDQRLAEQNGMFYITEKPTFPLKNKSVMYKAVTGLYIYTADVFDKIQNLKPSARGELEVSELNDMYAAAGDLVYDMTDEPWFDCGVDIDHMIDVSTKMKEWKTL